MPPQVGAPSNNPYGRAPGSRNRRTEDVWKALEQRGDKDPLDFLFALITNDATEPGLRVAAANYILPYKHSKRGPTPAPRYIEGQIDVPEFASITDAQNFLADISRRAGAGELELQSALDVSTLVKNWIMSIQSSSELDLKIAAQNGGSDQTIRIEGGLPALPGTSVIMDETAVGSMNGKVIDHVSNDSVNGHNVAPSLPQFDEPAANHLENNANTS
jgi:hypothetical protein